MTKGALLFALICVGCSHADPNEPAYSWAFHCKQGDSLRSVRVELDRAGAPFTVEVGVLGGIGTAHWDPGWRPMPAKGTVKWNDENGISHSQDVDVAANVPDSAHFNGDVFFLFDNGKWRVAPLSEAEQERRILAKDYRLTPD